jgi:hypothetical protein
MKGPGASESGILGTLVLIAAFGAQIVLWASSRDIVVAEPVVPPAPGQAVVAAVALGDTQAAYRAMGLQLQNFGDTGGQWTGLAGYDYDRLIDWFELLTDVDDRAGYVPVLAAYYYSQSPDEEHVRRVVTFVSAFARRDPATRWRLLGHAVYIARHRLRDFPLALTLARELAAFDVGEMPFWTRQLPALVLAEMGEREAAMREIRALQERYPDLPPEEARYHKYFLEEVLGVDTGTGRGEDVGH